MNDSSQDLNRFAKRIRLLRAWRGLSIGLVAGATLSSVWAGLDLARVVYADGATLAVVALGGAAIGAVIGFLRPLSNDQVVRSIDLRAHLEDRLTTALERRGKKELFDDALQLDAAKSLDQVSARQIYPIKWDRRQTIALMLCVLAASLFLLGNSPILLSPDAKKNRAEQQRQAEQVQRVAKETLETPEAKTEMTEAEKRLADELRKYQRDLERARMSPEESMQKANELAQKADELSKQKAKEATANLNNAQKAWEQMEKAQLEKAGLQDADPSLANMDPNDLNNMQLAAQEQVRRSQKELDSLKALLDAIDQKLKNPNLSPEERAKLEAQKKALQEKRDDAEKSRDKAQKDLAGLKFSKDAQDVLRRMRANPLYKEILELAKKLKNNAAAGSKDGRPPISDEERKKLQKEFDELVAKLKDDKELQKYLEAMKEAMLSHGGMCRCKKIGFGLPVPIPRTGQPGNGIMVQDNGKVNHSDKALKSEGSTQTSMISGEQRPGGEEQPYVEIKAPATLGNRSSVPYIKVLPSYRRKAESALNRQEISKEDQKRVRAYFEGLGH